LPAVVHHAHAAGIDQHHDLGPAAALEEQRQRQPQAPSKAQRQAVKAVGNSVCAGEQATECVAECVGWPLVLPVLETATHLVALRTLRGPAACSCSASQPKLMVLVTRPVLRARQARGTAGMGVWPRQTRPAARRAFASFLGLATRTTPALHAQRRAALPTPSPSTLTAGLRAAGCRSRRRAAAAE
jgi:hypothetical protein